MVHPLQIVPPPIDRRSWLWLAIGAVLLCFSSLQPSLPIAAWFTPLFLLRFSRTQRPPVGLSVLTVVLSVVLFSKWAIVGLLWLIVLSILRREATEPAIVISQPVNV